MGFCSSVGPLDHILFRDTSDDPQIAVSYNWWVWKINKERQYVGKLEGEHIKAELGLVYSPPNIVNRMKTGKYSGFYAGY